MERLWGSNLTTALNNLLRETINPEGGYSTVIHIFAKNILARMALGVIGSR